MYRFTTKPISEKEIHLLESQGCKCTDWSRVTVSDGFDASRVRNVEFSGDVAIGRLDGTFNRQGGLVRHSLIEDVTLHNVTIADNVYIRHIADYIANYDIAEGAYIENVDCLIGTLESSFGIGTEVSVLNETGGREVPIYERLSAQTAYLLAMYRHESAMVERLAALIKEKAQTNKGTRGRVGICAEITNCGTITDVNIGDYSHIKGATRLKDGTTASSQEQPVTIGRDVIAEGFVFASGSRVADGAVVHHCFVGQASMLSHLFSAHDSLFFANCNCENGEAAAIFGGPYTVTMHKSSLLIAGLFSFLNAGSGSNQSNHMYKLGPIHQGVVGRGSKTTSESYLLWPAKIGAFSLVMGRHVNHPDTSALPFSYLIENHSGSYLVPGVNLKSVGTIRDAQKWPKRDKRKGKDLLDCINFNLLSPYTVGQMWDGLQLLNDIERTAGSTSQSFSFQGMIIEARALRKGREYYRMAIDKFMGNSIIHRLADTEISDDAQIVAALAPTVEAGKGVWVDVCGLFAPKSEVDRIACEIANGTIATLKELESRWKALHSLYYEMEWTWVASQIERWWGKPVAALTREDLREMVRTWQLSVISLDRMLYEDARKEFSLQARTGFGIDDPACSADGDFGNVRGDFKSDPFVKMVLDHIDHKSALAARTLANIH